MVQFAPETDSVPLLGALPWIVREGILPFVERCWRDRGDVFHTRIGSFDQIFIVHPDPIREVLKNRRAIYTKGQSYEDLKLMVGNGLVTAEGDEWQVHRRIAQPAFHRTSLDGFAKTMGAMVDRALERWRTRRDRDEPLDVHLEMVEITMEIVAGTLFGADFAAGDEHARAFADTLKFLSDRGNMPVSIPMWMPTPTNRKLRSSLITLDRHMHELIERGRGQTDGKAKTLLQMLLRASDPETGESFSNKQLRDEVVTLFLAGHETTALGATWAFYFLERHPEIVRRIRAEASAVLDDGPTTAEQIHNLEYTKMVFQEVLRLRPPVWCVARDAARDDELDGFHVPKGTSVNPCIFLTHRHPEFWDAPEEFDPERFTEKASRGRHPFAYLPFSAGPRVCIGNTFALMEGSLMLAKILRECDLSLATEERLDMDVQITVRPSKPLRMNVRFLD